MERRKLAVKCRENEELAEYMLTKWQEMADQRPKGISENIEKTLSKAYSNLCSSKNPVQTLKDFSQIKGVGKWILKHMQGFFKTDLSIAEPENLTKNGKKTKRATRYLPQKYSVAYALLITLYRGIENGNEFMRKQELIDAAEASGLSRVPIAPEMGKGKPGSFGSSPREWYSGWTSMKTLVTKGLVVKSSCPAKYMLTQEGKEAARECISRSGLPDPSKDTSTSEGLCDPGTHNMQDIELVQSDSESDVEVMASPVNLRRQKPMDISPDYLERLVKMGYSKDRILQACCEVSKTSGTKDTGSSWLSILCHLREDEVYGSGSQTARKECPTISTPIDANGQVRGLSHHTGHMAKKFSSVDCKPNSNVCRACSSPGQRSRLDGQGFNILSMPPLSFGEIFEDAYEVVLVLDDREQFANKGSRSSKIIESVSSQFKIKIEVRRLPVGDGIWIARHKYLGREYVLDFIVERKKIGDLRSSIRDNRYRDQKLRLLRCGLKKLIYLVEGDPNYSEAAESIKTACFTTEILEGFDVQRTSGLSDTLKKYGHLTQAITEYYKTQIPEEVHEQTRVCPPFKEFIKKCEELDKMTVNDLFAIQLMQVQQVTEEVAMAVVDLYPTILSLASAYSLLEGDIAAQQDMLRKQSNNVVSAAASRNIFQLIWGN
ncbi:crossover junction endonuclease MUS81 isoform X1 [Morus notabilis]|uniref:crossover junction endonuclease MUS81 isoform X1 n=2 Tax=Morus notabilis TaxID=981085 RepID=UPI000CED55D2|nr:crossover junction endonuclease MUS81 isoform X1 [Morus notabilis]